MSCAPPTEEQLAAVKPEDRAELLQIVCAIIAGSRRTPEDLVRNPSVRSDIVNSAGALLILTKEKAAAMKMVGLL